MHSIPFFVCYNEFMRKSRIFLCFSLNFILGVFITSFFNTDIFWIYFFVITSVITLAVGYKNKIALVLGFSFLFLALGIWLTQSRLEETNKTELAGTHISELMIVAREPEPRETYQNVVLKKDDLKILAYADKFSPISYGDQFQVDCRLKVPENKGDSFDYRMYLAKDKILYICQGAKLEKVAEGKGNGIYSFILNLKNRMEENVNRVIPQPQAALANGLIFGGSSRLPQEVRDDFSKTGMTHIVAVSGYNVTIIAEYLMIFGIWLGLWRKKAFWFAVIGIILFVAMIGFPSSAVRAGVMGILLLWAMKNGRLANSTNAIFFAGGIMLLINPLLLRWDIGFQLSFLATLGIVLMSPIWEKYFVKKNKALGITEIFFLTLSAQIFVLPIIIYNFQNLSLVSVPANLLVLLIIPISMLLVFLTAVAGFIFYPLSLVLAWLAFLPLKYEVWIITTLANLKYASIKIEDFSFLGIAIWYVLLIGAVILLKRKFRKKKLVWQTEK